MLRKLLLTGLGTLVILCVGPTVFADTKYAPSDENLLKTSIHRGNGSSEMIKGVSVNADSRQGPMMAAAKKALTIVPRGGNAIAHSSGSMFLNGGGSGSSNGTGSTNGSSNGSSNGHVTPGQVPEPFSMILLGTGLVGLAAIVRKRRLH